MKGKIAQLKGGEAEQDAQNYLEEHGLVLVQKNYRCRRGELDLIMRDGDELVFVEVKYRRSDSHGSAAEFFDAHKRRKVEAAIASYMHEHQLNPALVAHRLDFIAIDNQRIDWIKSI